MEKLNARYSKKTRQQGLALERKKKEKKRGSIYMTPMLKQKPGDTKRRMEESKLTRKLRNRMEIVMKEETKRKEKWRGNDESML